MLAKCRLISEGEVSQAGTTTNVDYVCVSSLMTGRAGHIPTNTSSTNGPVTCCSGDVQPLSAEVDTKVEWPRRRPQSTSSFVFEASRRATASKEIRHHSWAPLGRRSHGARAPLVGAALGLRSWAPLGPLFDSASMPLDDRSGAARHRPGTVPAAPRRCAAPAPLLRRSCAVPAPLLRRSCAAPAPLRRLARAPRDRSPTRSHKRRTRLCTATGGSVCPRVSP